MTTTPQPAASDAPPDAMIVAVARPTGSCPYTVDLHTPRVKAGRAPNRGDRDA
jgi:hypothetical protein